MSQGDIRIHDDVIKSIVGKCALELPGIHSLSGTVVQSLIKWGSQPETRGITVETRESENSTRLELRVVVQSGFPIPTVAENLQRSVKEMVEKMTGLEVTAVDIYVDDIRDKEVKEPGDLEEQDAIRSEP